jgi:HAD superfamily hydrolase (TIGR01484 family)
VELIVFDLDGTLLNEESAISDYTSETLKLLAEQEIAYTVATGRALHCAKAILVGHQFMLPQAYKNGVVIWHPEQRRRHQIRRHGHYRTPRRGWHRTLPAGTFCTGVDLNR